MLPAILFWTHIGIIVFGMFMGLIFSLPIVLLLVGLHRLQLFVFKDCILSKFQKKMHAIPKKTHFFQFAALKIFDKRISDRNAKFVDYGIISFSISVAVLNYLI